MPEVQLDQTVSFFDYVYQDHAIDHSGVLSPALNLNPEYENITVFERFQALRQLEQYVSTSIVAYRAVAWWAARLDWYARDGYDQALISKARKICNPQTKPKTFYTYKATQVTIGG
jgi:hypothetical protein